MPYTEVLTRGGVTPREQSKILEIRINKALGMII